jgi:hypothetical protein
LADLGIEFKAKDENGENERYPERERVEKAQTDVKEKSVSIKSPSVLPTPTHPKIFSTIKKVFTRETNVAVKPPSTLGGFTAKKPVLRDNSALRDILNKTLNGDKVEEKKVEKVPEPAISLSELKETKPITNLSKDRSASKESMDKLKSFIEDKDTTIKDSSLQKEVPMPERVGIPTSDKNQNVGKEIKEVPEDVLRKILE